MQKADDPARPMEERLQALSEQAAFVQRNLVNLRQTHALRKPDDRDTIEWIDALLAHHDRLQALIASPDTTPQDAAELAQEVRAYVKQNKTKPMYIRFWTDQLAELLAEKEKTREALATDDTDGH